MTAQAKKYLKETTATANATATACTVTSKKTGTTLLSIKFDAIPMAIEIAVAVSRMISETNIPRELEGAIIRQVKTCVTHTL